MITYVAVITFGSYDDKSVIIVYAGNSLSDAQNRISEKSYMDIEYQQVFATIEHWENGNKIKEESIEF